MTEAAVAQSTVSTFPSLENAEKETESAQQLRESHTKLRRRGAWRRDSEVRRTSSIFVRANADGRVSRGPQQSFDAAQPPVQLVPTRENAAHRIVLCDAVVLAIPVLLTEAPPSEWAPAQAVIQADHALQSRLPQSPSNGAPRRRCWLPPERDVSEMIGRSLAHYQITGAIGAGGPSPLAIVPSARASASLAVAQARLWL